MELEHLREFTVLAETLNFARTAERLFTTQSTVSKHIKDLETELGVSLFSRTSRAVALTEDGLLFLPYAERILQTQYEYRTLFYNRAATRQTVLSIGSLPGLAQYQITDIIMAFRRENEHIRLEVLEADTAEVVEALLRDDCELAFVREYDMEERNDFVRVPYCKDSLVAVLPSNHPLASSGVLRMEDLAGEDFVLLKEKTFLYDLCLKECKKAGYTPNIVFTGHRLENIMDFVAKGMGISLLAKRQAMHLAPPGIVVTELSPSVTSNVNLVYKKSRRLSQAAAHFINCVERRSGETLLTQTAPPENTAF